MQLITATVLSVPEHSAISTEGYRRVIGAQLSSAEAHHRLARKRRSTGRLCGTDAGQQSRADSLGAPERHRTACGSWLLRPATPSGRAEDPGHGAPACQGRRHGFGVLDGGGVGPAQGVRSAELGVVPGVFVGIGDAVGVCSVVSAVKSLDRTGEFVAPGLSQTYADCVNPGL